ncbi:MAG: acyl-CoA dehydrogenase family protein [Candidatus Freyarchaeota archaeon]
MVDFHLSEEQIALREKARKFALEEVYPVAPYYDRTGEFPMEVIKKAHKEGLMKPWDTERVWWPRIWRL